MSNLDNLTAAILADSQAKAREITGAAKAEADAKAETELRLVKAESEKITADAQTEAARTAERILQGKILSIRDENLGAKREMLDKVFTEALKRLNDMPKNEYLEYLAGYLSKLDLSGEELIVPKKYGVASIDEINAFLLENGVESNPKNINGVAKFIHDRLVNKGKSGENGGKLDLTLNADAGRDIDGGFILVKEGIEQNHTFKSLLEYYRDELESEVLKILYA